MTNETAKALQEALQARDDRQDSMADKLGSYALANNRLDIEEMLDDEDHPRPSAIPRKRQLRPTGRSLNEGSDSELDANWNVPANLLTPEERQNNIHGIALARQTMEAARPKEPTTEEIKAAREAEAAEIRRRAHESWGDAV